MRIVAFFAIIFCSVSVYSQANLAIELSKSESSRKITIREGKRVVYKLQNGKSGKSRVKSIQQDSIRIGDKTIPVSKIIQFGKRPVDVRFLGIFLISAGGITAVSTILSGANDPCPDCQDLSDDDNGPIVAGILVSAASLGVGYAILESTFTRNIDGEKWSIRIVERK